MGEIGIRKPIFPWNPMEDIKEAELKMSKWASNYSDENHHQWGIMTEILQAVIQFGFGNLHLHRIAAEVFQGNTASERVLLKCGFQKESTLRDLYRKNGKYIDSTYYSIIETAKGT